jgi:uncharacterized protein (UPF0335 family)
MVDIGHNSVGVPDEVLTSFVSRIERLEDEKRIAAEDIRSIYTEAKDKEIDTKALRAVIKMRREDAAKRQEREAAIEAMLVKLGMV